MEKHILFVLLILFLSASSLFAQEGFHLLTTMSGDSTGDQFSVVSYIGDVNADGYDDVIVGAPGGDYAKLFFGGAVFDTIPDLTFRDYKQYNCQFGCSIAGDGDVNGDGYLDIIIGASSTWIGPSCPFECFVTGAAYIYFGGPAMDTTADLTLIVGDWLTQTGWYYGFGKSVCIPGDLNGDGYDDFVIGASNDDYDAHGRVYIYFGGPNVDDHYDALLEGEEVFDNFGASLSRVDDMNNDGFDDVLIGAPMFHNNIPNKIYQGGKAYLVYGSNEISLNNSIEFTGDTSSYYYGRFISGLDDVNGDSINDLGIMGGEYLNIISGNDFSTINSFYSAGDMWYISSLNNLNRDGFKDFAYVSDSLRIFFGQTLLDTIPNYVFNWAEQVSYLGFINNDSTPEIAFTVSGGWDPTGKIYVYSFGDLNSVDDEKNIKLNKYVLHQNYPNPFNSSTIIKYSLPQQEEVKLSLYDLLGRLITTLVNEKKNAGEHQIELNTKNLPSGVYFYQLNADNVILTNKLILLK
jgi:hypothetical protein